jgi:hypothetical protein
MPYNIIIPTIRLSGNTAVITGGSTRDGQPHADFTANFHGTDQTEFDEKSAAAKKFMASRKKLTDLSYKELCDFEKDATKELLSWGDEHQKKGKGQ